MADSTELPETRDPNAGPPTRVPLRIEDWIGALAMGALCLITFVNVVVRYLTDESFAWTEEISIFLMMAMSLVAGAAAVARDKHIRIEYFFEQGSAARQRRLAILSAVCVFAFFLLLAVLGARMAWDEFRFDETSPGIGVPKWIYSIWLPILCVAIAARALGLIMRKVGRK
jgi:TRAP-type C4-dicarboxylate transport system permease small subunit